MKKLLSLTLLSFSLIFSYDPHKPDTKLIRYPLPDEAFHNAFKVYENDFSNNDSAFTTFLINRYNTLEIIAEKDDCLNVNLLDNYIKNKNKLSPKTLSLCAFVHSNATLVLQQFQAELQAYPDTQELVSFEKEYPFKMFKVPEKQFSFLMILTPEEKNLYLKKITTQRWITFLLSRLCKK